MSIFKLLAAFAAVGLALPAQATTITNGDFTSFSSSNGGKQPGGVCYQTTPSAACTNLGGWTNTDGYTFISNSANLGVSAYGGYTVALDAFPTGPSGAPTLGQYYLAVDGVAWGAPRGALSQTLNGLTMGDHYSVSFWQAAAQQSTYSGATTEQWQVSFTGGGFTQNGFSTLMSTPSKGTYGWNYQTLNFVATAASETISFYALGTPNGDPPFVLLDDISISDIPEPSTLAAIGTGMLALLAHRRRARRAAQG